MASATGILTPGNRTDTATNALNKAAKHWRGNAFLQTICVLADYLDQHATPINYQHRRQLDFGDLLAEPVWDQIASTRHASRRLRHHIVRAWLYQHITGNRLSDAPSPFTIAGGHERREVNDLPRYLHLNLRRALEDHAQRYLQQHGLFEPSTWHPPLNIAPSQIPRPVKIDLVLLHDLASRRSTALGTIAEKLGTTLAHVRLLLQEHPLPSSHLS